MSIAKLLLSIKYRHISLYQSYLDPNISTSDFIQGADIAEKEESFVFNRDYKRKTKRRLPLWKKNPLKLLLLLALEQKHKWHLDNFLFINELNFFYAISRQLNAVFIKFQFVSLTFFKIKFRNLTSGNTFLRFANFFLGV